MSKRWIQHPITFELVPRDEYVRPKEASHAIFNDLEGFVSPIDGEVITDRKRLREHMRKHGVVHQAEFDGQWSEAAQKRAAFYEGRSNQEEAFKRKQAINEIINHHEAQRG